MNSTHKVMICVRFASLASLRLCVKAVLNPGWLAIVALLLSACDQSEPTPTPTRTPTPISAPVLESIFTPAVATVMAPPPTPIAAIENTALPIAAAIPTATPLPPAPANPEGLLASGLQLHRYGDYAGARQQFAAVANDATVDITLRAAAIYDLGRAYLGESVYGEALATFDRLEQLLASVDVDANQFAAKEQYLRAQALVGVGRYADAIAAYWRFLETYPWMSEAVQPRIAEAYLALNDPASAATAYRRAADDANPR